MQDKWLIPLADRYIRNGIPLEDLELRARYPPVDAMGREKARSHAKDLAGAVGE